MILTPKMSPRCLFSSKNVSKPILQALAVTALRSRLHQIWLQRGAYLAPNVSPSYGRNFTAVQSRPPCGWYWLQKCLQGAFLAPKTSPSSLIFTGSSFFKLCQELRCLFSSKNVSKLTGFYWKVHSSSRVRNFTAVQPPPNMTPTRCILSYKYASNY